MGDFGSRNTFGLLQSLLQQRNALVRLLGKSPDNGRGGFFVFTSKSGKRIKIEFGRHLGLYICLQQVIQQSDQLLSRERLVQESGKADFQIMGMLVFHTGRKRDDRHGICTGDTRPNE